MTLPTDQDKRGYDALIEDLRDAINEGAGDLATACAEAISTLLRERDALREALKPFAREAEDWGDKMDCEDIPAEATDIKISDLRKARAALSTPRAMKEPSVSHTQETAQGPAEESPPTA